MSILVAQFQGRFGNCAMQWLFAKAFAAKHGFEFQCDRWDGENVFDITDARPGNVDGWPRYNEAQLAQSIPDRSFVFRGYGQTQFCVGHYTKREARRMLMIKPDIIKHAAAMKMPEGFIIAHVRRGDYAGYGYPLVSEHSYIKACTEHGLNHVKLFFCNEERPSKNADLEPFGDFVPDFMLLMCAAVLLRGNSTFSWIAGLLRDGPVFSPIIEGLEGGKEHDCKFVPGNWPRFTNLDFVEDLHVAP